MWPEGGENKTDDKDLAWKSAVSPKIYMKGVSPWFFHSITGGTRWIWRGDDLWHDRWEQTLSVAPDFVEIVTRNIYGEATYIGPIYSDTEIPKGPKEYVEYMPPESWRDFLSYYISRYKSNNFDITRDQMRFCYRLAPAAGGSAYGVDGNDPGQNQTAVDPNTIVEDAVFFSALLMSPATIEVQIGSNAAISCSGNKGINYWSQHFNGQTGAVTVSVIRHGNLVNNRTGPAITPLTNLANGCTNYNAWVGSFYVTRALAS